jgi:hypothetical protein
MNRTQPIFQTEDSLHFQDLNENPSKMHGYEIWRWVMTTDLYKSIFKYNQVIEN